VPASLIQAWTMSKHFRPWNIDQTLLLPPSVQDFVPKDHVSHFIVGLARESLQRTQSRSARSTWYRRLCRTWTRSAPDSGKRKSWWTADATDAQKDRRRRLRNALPIEKASGGAGVRTDQTGTRLPPVPVARRQESTCRVGHDLHHPQPPEAVRPRKGRLRRLPCNKCPAAMPIWTGS